MRIEHDVDVFSAPRLRERLNEAIRETSGDFTLDMRSVRYIDSVGLGLLVYAKRMLEHHGRALSLVVEREGAVQRILDITGLGTLLDVRLDGPGIDGT